MESAWLYGRGEGKTIQSSFQITLLLMRSSEMLACGPIGFALYLRNLLPVPRPCSVVPCARFLDVLKSSALGA